jgi:hypothetical protein
VVCVAALGGCATESRVVSWNPILGRLPGAETQIPVTGPRGSYTDPTKLPEAKVREEAPDGTVTLRARTGRQLMQHIYTTLRDGERDLFTEQVLSRRTRSEFEVRGHDPREAFDMLLARGGDVQALFDAMPMGEQTPGVFLESVGDGVLRFRVSGRSAMDLRWTGIDMVMEDGSYRLRWFVGR